MAKLKTNSTYGIRRNLPPVLTWGLAIALSAASLYSHGAAYYRWVDQEGVTHYTSTPPQGVPSEKVSTGSGSTSPAAPAATQESSTEQATDTSQQPSLAQQRASLKDEELCRAAQDRLQTLQSGRRLRVPTEDGGFRYLSEEDIKEELSVTQRAIDESC